VTDLHTFDDQRGWHAFLSDAYRGGWQWDHPSSPTLGTARLYGYDVQRDATGREVVTEVQRGTERTYLVPWTGESLANFRRRKHLAFYANFAEPIVDAYVDSTTGAATRDLGVVGDYLSSLDGDGQGWDEHVAVVARQMGVHGVVAVVIEPPRANAAETREQELAARVSVRARVVPPTAWAWLSTDDDGVVEFAYADNAVIDTTTSAQAVTIWRYTRSDWQRFDASLSGRDTIAGAASRILAGKPTATGPLPPSLMGRVPVVFATHRRDALSRVPAGRSLAASPAAIGRQVYQLLSQVEDTQRRAPAFLAMPTAARGGLEPETQAKLGPDSALPIPDGAGPPQWVTFPSESLADIRAHVGYLVGLAYRTAGLEVQADQSAQVQSGEALRVRSRDFESRAQKFAADCLAYETRALALVAQMLGVSAPPRVSYPKRYVLGDPSELLASAVMLLQTVGDRIGGEGITEAVKQAVSAALALDDDALARVMDEVAAKMASPPPSPRQPPPPVVDEEE
jgi:hypothetical protein